jgi:FAD/FMN-containing dehydrogenase/Fe-S oxidoreductase
VDVASLERRLVADVEGEVRFDDGTRGLYATDSSNYRQVPIGVVIPKKIDDVVATHAACHSFGAPILARGCGTSMSGEAVNVAVVIDFSKYLTEILHVDPEAKLARVQPGVIHDQLSEKTKKWGLIFAPDPATHEYCTIGGNIGNNSCGTHSVQAEFLGDGPRTSDNVHEMEVLTHDGVRLKVGATSDEELQTIVRAGGRRAQIYADLKALADKYGGLIRDRFPDIPRRVSGYNLDELLPEKGFNVARALVGTEGTCVNVLEATVRLVDDPPARTLVVVGYQDIFAAGDHVPLVRAHEPQGIEGVDDVLIRNQRRMGMNTDALEMLPEGSGFLFVEFGAEDRGEVDEKATRLLEELKNDACPPMGIVGLSDPNEQRRAWQIRESGFGATAFPPGGPDHWPGWEDSAVPPEKVGPYLRDLRDLYGKYGYAGALYGHLGQGCIHSHISFDMRSDAGIAKHRSFVEEAADLCVSYGGSLSGEHGDGQQRGELLPRMYGDELVEAFREFKRIWDPDWKMNPGKVVDPSPLDQDLKLAPANYQPPAVQTHFAYPEDDGDFPHATVRCVGIGKCRTRTEGTMCPSFQVTREEKHSTRGRARMLFEMLQGDPVRDGWHDEDVKDSLDLCLACKGCKSECPVSVDIATYKAEFLSHYYQGRRRPRVAYSVGLIHRWSRVASKVPNITNFVGHAPGLSTLLKATAGVAAEREIPPFATETLRAWFERRPVANPEGDEVVVWPDTFNNFLHPEVGKATIEVLEGLGYKVKIPPRVLCCGRPLYDYGMLDEAKTLLYRTIEALRVEIEEGTPIVGIEPSCIAVFRDELTGLLPDDDEAKKLEKQFFTFGEFLVKKVPSLPHVLDRKAIVHPHCHQDAVIGMEHERTLLGRLGVDFQMTDAGCCGLAGSFGFEPGEKYEVSVKAGESKLAPLIRKQDDETLIVADGFSCKTQIGALTGRRALHLAQVVRMAMEHGSKGAPDRPPERAYPDIENGTAVTPLERLLIGGALLTGLAFAVQRRKGSRGP